MGRSIPHRIVFVSGRCVFAYDAMLDLMSCWAKGRSNERHVESRIGDARGDLARGADRAAVIRSVVQVFRGAAVADLEAVTRDHLRRAHPWARSPRLSMPARTAAESGVEVVLVSDMALYGLAEEISGVDALLCSSPVCSGGRLTGEIALVSGAAERLAAAVRYAEERRVDAADCVLLHRGDLEDAALLDLVGDAVELDRSAPAGRPDLGRVAGL